MGVKTKPKLNSWLLNSWIRISTGLAQPGSAPGCSLGPQVHLHSHVGHCASQELAFPAGMPHQQCGKDKQPVKFRGVPHARHPSSSESQPSRKGPKNIPGTRIVLYMSSHSQHSIQSHCASVSWEGFLGLRSDGFTDIA